MKSSLQCTYLCVCFTNGLEIKFRRAWLDGASEQQSYIIILRVVPWDRRTKIQTDMRKADTRKLI